MFKHQLHKLTLGTVHRSYSVVSSDAPQHRQRVLAAPNVTPSLGADNTHRMALSMGRGSSDRSFFTSHFSRVFLFLSLDINYFATMRSDSTQHVFSPE